MKLSTLQFVLKVRRAYPYVCVKATGPAGEEHEFFVRADLDSNLDNPGIIASKVITLMRQKKTSAAADLKKTYVSIFLANRELILEALNEAKLDYIEINNIIE